MSVESLTGPAATCTAPLRILVLGGELSSRLGGQELSLLDVCRGLAARGHRLRLLYTAGGDLEPRYREFCKDLTLVATYTVDRHQTFRSASGLVRSLLRLRSVRTDVVYANQYLDSLFAGLLAQSLKAPFVCHLRLPPPDVLCGQYRAGMARSSRLIAVSQSTRSEWIGRGFKPDAIDVVYNGIDIARFPFCGDVSGPRARLGLPSDAFVVSYAGRVHPAKGLVTLLNAFRTVRATHRQSLLVVAATGMTGPALHHRHELDELAQQLGIAGAIRWLDNGTDVTELFRASDVSVLPSLWSEPFGRVLVESMACGTPAVGSRVGGIPELLRGGFAGHLVEAGNANELADVLARFRRWREWNPDLGQRSRAHVARHFSLDTTVLGIERGLLRAVEAFAPRERLGAVATSR